MYIKTEFCIFLSVFEVQMECDVIAETEIVVPTSNKGTTIKCLGRCVCVCRNVLCLLRCNMRLFEAYEVVGSFCMCKTYTCVSYIIMNQSYHVITINSNTKEEK